MDPCQLLMTRQCFTFRNFILLLLISGHSVSAFFSSGGSSPKSDGEVVPPEVFVVVGNTLTLNCTLTSYTITNLRSSALYFQSVYDNTPPKLVDPVFYEILTSEMLQLCIPNVTRETGGTYKCYINDSVVTNKSSDTHIASGTVYIGEGPKPLIVSVISENFQSMTVTWCPEVPPTDPANSSLMWHIENSTTSGVCTMWNNNITAARYRCSCVFCGETVSGVCAGATRAFYPLETYNISIISFNNYGSSYANLEVYTSQEIVKPGPVSELTVQWRNSTSFALSWKYPVGLSLVTLTFQINASCIWNTSSIIDVGYGTSWILTDLVPYTMYSIAVRSKPEVGGYWSDNSTVSNSTLEDAPAVGPGVPTGFFRKSSCIGKTECEVTVFWQLIDEKQRNGVIHGYRVTVESAQWTNKLNVSGGDTTSASISIPLGADSWVRVVAYTSVGDSPAQYIYFPLNFESVLNAFDPNLQSYGEFTQDGKGIFFSWNYIENVHNYTLMYCVGVQTNSKQCQSSPVEIILPGHQTNFTLNVTTSNLVYSLSSNYKNGTSGLTSEWICVFDYAGPLAMPHINSITPITDTSMNVAWSPQLCSTTNRVRVQQYFLSCIPESGGDAVNVTLPGSATQYEIKNLKPQTNYNLTLYGQSRSGPGPAAKTTFQTTFNKSTDSTWIVYVAVGVALGVVLILVLIYIAYRYRHWRNSITIKTPPRIEVKDSPYQSAASANYNSVADYNYATLQNVEAHICDEMQLQHSESDDGTQSNVTTETSVEDIHSIQTYTAAAAVNNSNKTPSGSGHSTFTVENETSKDHRVQSDFDKLLLGILPTSDSSGSGEYSRANQCNSFGTANQCNSSGSANQCNSSGSANHCNSSGSAIQCNSSGSANQCNSSGTSACSDAYKSAKCRDDDDVILSGPAVPPTMVL